MNPSSSHPKPSSRTARLQALIDVTQGTPYPKSATHLLLGLAFVQALLCATMIALGDPSIRIAGFTLLTLIFTLHAIAETRSQRRFDEIHAAIRDLASQNTSDERNA